MVHLAVSRAILRKRKGRRGRNRKNIYLTNQSIKVYTDKVKQINQALK